MPGCQHPRSPARRKVRQRELAPEGRHHHLVLGDFMFTSHPPGEACRAAKKWPRRAPSCVDRPQAQREAFRRLSLYAQAHALASSGGRVHGLAGDGAGDRHCQLPPQRASLLLRLLQLPPRLLQRALREVQGAHLAVRHQVHLQANTQGGPKQLLTGPTPTSEVVEEVSVSATAASIKASARAVALRIGRSTRSASLVSSSSW